MSFSLTIPETPVDDIEAAIDSAVQYELTEATVETLDAVKAAVRSLVDSGVLGDDRVVGSVSGHANPGHKPTKGWANDCVTISLTAVGAPPADE